MGALSGQHVRPLNSSQRPGEGDKCANIATAIAEGGVELATLGFAFEFAPPRPATIALSLTRRDREHEIGSPDP
jgi:hypothetical protein